MPCGLRNILRLIDEEEARVTADKCSVDVFLVGISLHPERPKDISGVEFAKELRKIRRYAFTPIIFITDVYDTFMNLPNMVQCYGIIQKPYMYQAMKRLIADAMRYQTMDFMDRVFMFHVNGMFEMVPAKSIIYANANNYCLYIHTTERTLEMPYKTCRYLQEKLNSDDFVQCERSTIVNANYVRRVDTSDNVIYLKKCSDTLKIGQVYKKDIIKRWGRSKRKRAAKAPA